MIPLNLLVLRSAGDEEVVLGRLEEDILLPCSCPRNLDSGFKWQVDKPLAMRVLKYTNSSLFISDSYKGRVKVFLAEENQNCSLQLVNVTAEDQGKYRCTFSIQQQYVKKFVHLNISGESL